MAAVICSATATAAVTSPNVVLVAEWVVVPSAEAGSAIVATASELAVALSPGCEFVVFAFGISVDVGAACFAVRSFAAVLDSASRIRVASRSAAFGDFSGDFSPAAVVGETRRGWPGVGVIWRDQAI